MNDLSTTYNLREGERQFRKHSFSRQNFLKPIKIGPEPFNTDILRGLHYISTTTLPPLTRDAKDVPYQGSVLKEMGQLQFGNETTIGFRTPADFMAYNALQQWSFELGNPLDGSAKYCVGNDSTIQYVVTDKQNRIVRAVEFIGVFPSSVGEVSYDNTTDDITTFDVTFTYNYWTPIPLEGLDLDHLSDNANSSDSAQTNTSVIFDDYESLIREKDSKTDSC